jgi:hypothetical protein
MAATAGGRTPGQGGCPAVVPAGGAADQGSDPGRCNAGGACLAAGGSCRRVILCRGGIAARGMPRRWLARWWCLPATTLGPGVAALPVPLVLVVPAVGDPSGSARVLVVVAPLEANKQATYGHFSARENLRVCAPVRVRVAQEDPEKKSGASPRGELPAAAAAGQAGDPRRRATLCRRCITAPVTPRRWQGGWQCLRCCPAPGGGWPGGWRWCQQAGDPLPGWHRCQGGATPMAGRVVVPGAKPGWPGGWCRCWRWWCLPPAAPGGGDAGGACRRLPGWW